MPILPQSAPHFVIKVMRPRELSLAGPQLLVCDFELSHDLAPNDCITICGASLLETRRGLTMVRLPTGILLSPRLRVLVLDTLERFYIAEQTRRRSVTDLLLADDSETRP